MQCVCCSDLPLSPQTPRSVTIHTALQLTHEEGKEEERERWLLFSSVGSTAFKTFQPIIFQKALNVVYVLSGTRTGLGMCVYVCCSVLCDSVWDTGFLSFYIIF